MSVNRLYRYQARLPSHEWETTLKLLLTTAIALIAFAANSILCRLALKGEQIDATSFTSIRLLSGAVVLALIISATQGAPRLSTKPSNFLAPVMLFIYAFGFSLAYLQLNTGTGALVLFGVVQVTLIAINLLRGQTIRWLEWIGIALAFAGLVYLVLPGASAPPLTGFLLMALAGVAWGIYTYLGKGSATATLDTAQNFIYSLPLVVVATVITGFVFNTEFFTNYNGMLYAVLSGALASGCGYALWYQALPKLSTTESAVLQLLVPVIAAAGGVVFVNEPIDTRLLIAALMTLSGIGAVIVAKRWGYR